MTAAAQGLGWPGQPDQGAAASSDGVPARPGRGAPAAAAGPAHPSDRPAPGEVVALAGLDGLGWPGAVTRAAATVSRETGPDRSGGLAAGWRESEMDMAEGIKAVGRHHAGVAPATAAATGRPRGPAPDVADFGAADVPLAADDREVVMPAVTDTGSDTPIARAARAALAARAGGTAWPRPKACRTITIANQKGGVGKTTTAVNLDASLALHGARVLVIELDPQGNASTALGVNHSVGTPSIYDVLLGDGKIADVVASVEISETLFCAPATIDLAGADLELASQVSREYRLQRALIGLLD